MKYAMDFIEAIEREDKPRKSGLTGVRDPGMGMLETQMFIESAGMYTDWVKFRNMMPRFFSHDWFVKKVNLYKDNNINVLPGGITGEMAFLQGKWDQTLEYMVDVGVSGMEVSENYVNYSHAEKIKLVHDLRDNNIHCFFEWGVKKPHEPLKPEMAIKEINDLISEGVNHVIVEEGEIDMLLGVDGQSENSHLLVELIEGVGIEHLMIEAIHSKQQAWLLKNYGTTVNIGPNVLTHEVLWLESNRRGMGRGVDYFGLDEWLEKTGRRRNDA
jgi:phosphosulfolactate synthase